MKDRATVVDAPPGPEATSPPPDTVTTDTPDPARDRKREPERERLSPTMRSIANEEERSLKDWLDIIGTQGAFKVQIHREKPQSVTINGKTVETAGYLETVEEAFEDDYLKKEWGGGVYNIKVTKKGDDGTYRYQKGYHRTIRIAGDPRVDRLPGNAPSPVATTTPGGGENPSIAKAALDMMKDQLERVSATPPRGIDPAMQMLIEQMRRDADARDRQLAALQTKLDSLSSQKPPEDTVKDQLLGTLIKGESGRIDALRAQHESELRQLREHHQTEIRTLNERFDRDRDNDRRQADRLLDNLKAGYEREISAMRSSGDVTVTSNKSAFDVQVHTLNGDIKRLERDLERAQADCRELREKKDKSVFDMLKEVEAFKDAIGAGDEKAATSAWEKVAETIMNPAALEQIGKMFGATKPGPAVQAQVTAVATPPARPRILRDRRTGDRFAAIPNPAVPGGMQMVPVKKIPQKVQKEDGSQVEVPEVEPSQVALLVQYLERAFVGGQDPVVVAQSGRSMVPDAIVTWIRDNDQGTVSGVDLFMSKVAKLPGTSPLQTQRGRNWLRKVGRALAGDEPTPETTDPETPTPPPPPPTAAT